MTTEGKNMKTALIKLPEEWNTPLGRFKEYFEMDEEISLVLIIGTKAINLISKPIKDDSDNQDAG